MRAHYQTEDLCTQTRRWHFLLMILNHLHRLEKIMIFDLKDQRSLKWSWSFARIRSFFVQRSDLFKNLDLDGDLIWSRIQIIFFLWSDLVNDLEHFDDLGLDLLRKIERWSRWLYFGKTKNLGASRHPMPLYISIRNMDLILSPSSVSNRMTFVLYLRQSESRNEGEESRRVGFALVLPSPPISGFALVLPSTPVSGFALVLPSPSFQALLCYFPLLPFQDLLWYFPLHPFQDLLCSSPFANLLYFAMKQYL